MLPNFYSFPYRTLALEVFPHTCPENVPNMHKRSPLTSHIKPPAGGGGLRAGWHERLMPYGTLIPQNVVKFENLVEISECDEGEKFLVFLFLESIIKIVFHIASEVAGPPVRLWMGQWSGSIRTSSNATGPFAMKARPTPHQWSVVQSCTRKQQFAESGGVKPQSQ